MVIVNIFRMNKDEFRIQIADDSGAMSMHQAVIKNGMSLELQHQSYIPSGVQQALEESPELCEEKRDPYKHIKEFKLK